MTVDETDVLIKTPDGECDAAFFYPETGSYAAVLIWPDAGGLRPVFREMGKHLAAQGYAVLVPNPFYRNAKAPVFGDFSNFDFGNEEDRKKLFGMMATLTAPSTEKDARAFVSFLDAQPQVDTSKKIGTQGYCMGGKLVMRTCATVPDRLGAGASFHGGGLVTSEPDSPHLLAPKIEAKMYIAIAANDDEKEPDAKTQLKDAFTAAHNPADIEVYPHALHGWCIADMPANAGPIYNQADAERAWSKLIDLYDAALA